MEFLEQATGLWQAPQSLQQRRSSRLERLAANQSSVILNSAALNEADSGRGNHRCNGVLRFDPSSAPPRKDSGAAVDEAKRDPG